MKKVLFVLLSVALLMSCAREIVDLTGDIKGVVKDADDGHLIENCLVTLTPGNTSVTTNQGGIFEFTDLTPGEYTLSFKKVGYPDHSQVVTIVTGEVKNVDVLMKGNAPFAFSEDVLNFGDFATNKQFFVVNNSDTKVTFAFKQIPEWLELSKTSGTIDAGSQMAVTATINREMVDYGSYSQSIIATYTGRSTGESFLTVKFEKVLLTAPSVTCRDEAKNITQTGFSIEGNLVSTGGSQIIAHGHCWSTEQNPTIGGANVKKTELGQRAEVGTFVSSVTDLTTNTTYYVRAYAQNAQGLSYSDQVVVTTQDVHSDKWDGALAKEFAGGNGTKGDPYIIKTGGQLLLIKDYSDKYFEIANDIDLDNRNWKPIEKFSGKLDGKGCTISNLRVERDECEYRGLIGQQTGGSISNITIKGVKISGDCTGAVVGYMYDGQITNCDVILTADSELKGDELVGGIVGNMNNYQGYIIDCDVESVANDDKYRINGKNKIGGIIGEGYGANVKDCHVNCNIIGEKYVGGIVGKASVDIENCMYQGQLSGTSYVGGISGYASKIIGCKVVSDIECDGDNVGGICGSAQKSIACYVEGIITCGNSSAKNVYGISYGSANLCYSTMLCDHTTFQPIAPTYGTYITDSYSVYDDVSNIASKLEDAYSEYADYWDFYDTWTWSGVVAGKNKSVVCPRLAWEN